jgi:NAD-dependent SIR2 family protein deacetylase
MEYNTIRAGAIEQFAKLLYERRQDLKAPVLLVGAGISIESGGPSGFGLMESIVNEYKPTDTDWDEACEKTLSVTPEEKKKEKARRFQQSLGSSEQLSADEREEYTKVLKFLYSLTIARRSVQEIYGVFDKHLQYHQPSQGYEFFAYLAKKGYFEWILSTNFDPLIEEALFATALPHYDFIQFSRRLTDPKELAHFIESDFRIPRIKLFKIHGDLKSRKVDAIGETIQRFSEEEEQLKHSLISLVRQRDLVVIGHSLQDEAINQLIKQAYDINKTNGWRLNSVWLLTMSQHEAQGCEILKELRDLHLDQHSAGIYYLEMRNDEDEKATTMKGSDPRAVHYFFDKCMADTFRHLSHLENEREHANGKDLANFKDIYYTCGMTANKKQLMHLVVAPTHIDPRMTSASDQNYLYAPGVLDDNASTFKEDIAPIYFSSLKDALAVHLLSAGLKRNRSDAKVHPIMSDFPSMRAVFVRDVFLTSKKKVAEAATPDEQAPPAVDNMSTEQATPEVDNAPVKGVRALSYALFDSWDKLRKEDEKRKTLRVRIDSDLSHEAAFFQKQGYKEMQDEPAGHGRIILHTLLLLAGNSQRVEVVNSDDWDLSLSFQATEDALTIRIHRFIPILTQDTIISQLLRTESEDPRDLLFLTVGGPEHNKLLELFIALYRHNGGQVVLNHANYFDRDELQEATSAVALFTESYVGGVAVRQSGDVRTQQEQNRTGAGAFVITFNVPVGALPWEADGDDPTKGKRAPIRVVAVVGLSAVGSLLGLAYVAFQKKFSVARDNALLIDIPPRAQANRLMIANVTPKERDFVQGYLNYLWDEENGQFAQYDIHVAAGNPTEFLAKLSTPVEKGFYRWMEENKIHFADFADYETHAKLWSLIAERYLVKQP